MVDVDRQVVTALNLPDHSISLIGQVQVNCVQGIAMTCSSKRWIAEPLWSSTPPAVGWVPPEPSPSALPAAARAAARAPPAARGLLPEAARKIAFEIPIRLNVFLETHDLGLTLGADGMLKILPGTVRLPDVSFIRWECLPAEPLPRRPIPALVPDLAVEVLSEGNTEAERQDKLQTYFQAGVRLVWYIDPQTRSANVSTSQTEVTLIDEHGMLVDGDVLPGLQLSMQQLFATADRRKPT